MDGDYFSQRKSKLERRMKAALGPAASLYRIERGNQRIGKYCLVLPAESIRFVKDGVAGDAPGVVHGLAGEEKS